MMAQPRIRRRWLVIPSVVLLIIVVFSLAEPRAICNPTPLTVPPGFCVTVFAEGVGRARHLTVSDAGTVYVILRPSPQRPASGGIVALADMNRDGKAELESRFGNVFGTDIEWRKPYLYAASDDALVRFHLKEGEIVPSSPAETVVSGFPDFAGNGEHLPKPFAFDDERSLFVHVGAPSNSCQEVNRRPRSPGRDPCDELARAGGIWRFDASSLGQVHTDDGVRVATGVRSTLGMAWNSGSKSLQLVQNGRDDLARLWPGVFNDDANAELPSEELLAVFGTARFGWPYCFHHYSQNIALLAPEYGGDGLKVGHCADFDRPLMVFPAHWVPADLLFYAGKAFPGAYEGMAFVSFQGGWGRRPYPQQGFRVISIPYRDGRPAGSWTVFIDGFAGSETVNMPGDAEYRPFGLAQGPDGSLFVSDARMGRVWRISYSS